MSDLDRKLAALPGMRLAELRALWRDVWRKPAPDIGPDLMRRGIAWKLQARAQGDLPTHVRRQLEGVMTRLRRGEVASIARPPLRPGTRLVREWQGRTYQVVVLERGYEHNGREFRSLTHVARAITGTHQSGTLFFGLRNRFGPKPSSSS